MAIQFLNSVNLTQNQLIKAAIENQGGDVAAGTGVQGQLYFDTSVGAKVLKVWNGTGWVEVGGGVLTVSSGNVNTITIGGTTSNPTVSANTAAVSNGSLNLVTGDAVYDFVTGIGYVESVDVTGSTFINVVEAGTLIDPTFAVSLSATGTPSASTFLRGDNSWSAISEYTSWILAGSSGTPQTISSGNTATFAAGTYITTTAGATDILTITHNATTRADTVSSVSPALGASFTAVDSVTTNSTGHVTALNLKTVTLPTTAVTQASGDSSTNIATTAFVQAAVTGLLEFKGGFNASTGQITSGSNNGLYLFGATRVAIAVGDYYVVTIAGDFYGSVLTPLTPGDSVIATVARAANLSIEADWSVVQSDTDIATSVTLGIGNVNAGNGISVTYVSGTAVVSANSLNKKITLSVGTGITKATSGGVTTFTINLATAWVSGILASNVICEVIDATTFLTVYAEVGRTSVVSNNLTIAMTGTIADGLYYVLLSNIV